MPYMLAALEHVDRVRAVHMLELAQVMHLSVAAAVAAVTPAPKKARPHIQKITDRYQRMLAGLHARATGAVGEQVDAEGRKIIKSMAQLRRYLDEHWKV